jgi:hypothetical protein
MGKRLFSFEVEALYGSRALVETKPLIMINCK